MSIKQWENYWDSLPEPKPICYKLGHEYFVDEDVAFGYIFCDIIGTPFTDFLVKLSQSPAHNFNVDLDVK